MPDIIRPTLKFIRAGYIAVLLLVIAAAVITVRAEKPLWIPAAVALLLLWPAQHHMRRQTTSITIVGDKLRYEAGFLSKTTRTIQLSKVQDVSVNQSLVQRIFNIGDLSIETAGETSRLTIRGIDSPQAIADAITEASHRGSTQGPKV